MLDVLLIRVWMVTRIADIRLMTTLRVFWIRFCVEHRLVANDAMILYWTAR